MNVFFTECSGHGISERRSKVMRPTKCKKEEDLFQTILDWEEELRELRKITGDPIMDEGGMVLSQGHLLRKDV